MNSSLIKLVESKHHETLPLLYLKQVFYSCQDTVDAEAPNDSQEPETVNTEDQKWLETSWCVLDLEGTDQNMFNNLQTPEQISIVAASYFSKQLRMFTDAIINMQLLDDIFKLFMVSA